MPTFDAARPIDLNMPDGRKIRVRFPGDEEWMELLGTPAIVQHLGRGKTMDMTSDRSEAALFEKIRLESAELSPRETARIISIISRAEVLETERTDAGFRVSLRVLGSDVAHLLRMPSAEQAAEFVVSARKKARLPHGRTETRINLQAGATLYDAIVEGTENYVGSVPIIHKMEAAKAVVKAVMEA